MLQYKVIGCYMEVFFFFAKTNDSVCSMKICFNERKKCVNYDSAHPETCYLSCQTLPWVCVLGLRNWKTRTDDYVPQFRVACGTRVLHIRSLQAMNSLITSGLSLETNSIYSRIFILKRVKSNKIILVTGRGGI
jgi:hypothetical protein